ncbi:hypothetical protein B0H13DRAFT_2461650 [Mycena leptocephala]|nr:hypothetical protein B0H13DRAFT_2461650 [Mycena leptocephala]
MHYPRSDVSWRRETSTSRPAQAPPHTSRSRVSMHTTNRAISSPSPHHTWAKIVRRVRLARQGRGGDAAVRKISDRRLYTCVYIVLVTAKLILCAAVTRRDAAGCGGMRRSACTRKGHFDTINVSGRYHASPRLQHPGQTQWRLSSLVNIAGKSVECWGTAHWHTAVQAVPQTATSKQQPSIEMDAPIIFPTI